jgi:hypothetical protein
MLSGVSEFLARLATEMGEHNDGGIMHLSIVFQKRDE